MRSSFNLNLSSLNFVNFHSAFPKTTLTLGITHEKQGWAGEAAKTRGPGQLAQQPLRPHHGVPTEQTDTEAGPMKQPLRTVPVRKHDLFSCIFKILRTGSNSLD